MNMDAYCISQGIRSFFSTTMDNLGTAHYVGSSGHIKFWHDIIELKFDEKV